MMWGYQENEVEKVIEKKEEIESQISVYQMRVQQASHLEKELAHLEEVMVKEEYDE
jgi:hypothetical protein